MRSPLVVSPPIVSIARDGPIAEVGDTASEIGCQRA
jgi:hypothetical protein